MPDPRIVYRLLLKLYPARFREEYEKPLERQFWDEYNEIQGAGRRTAFWLHSLTDLALSIPGEVLHELRQDLCYAFRLYRQRSFTVMLALIALALTIGITTGVFSVVNALLLRSLPFREPERLVQLQNLRGHNENAADFHSWAASRSYLADAAAYRTEDMTLGTDGPALRVRVAETTSNLFDLLGTQPLIGRAFDAGEDAPGRTDVAIVGHGLWQQLGGDPRILGATVHVNGVPLIVVGVAPKGLDYPGKAEVWVPSLFHLGHLSRSRAITWVVNGRLRPGVSLSQATLEYRADSAESGRAAGRKLAAAEMSRLRLLPLRDQLAGNVRRVSLVLFGLVVFVLLTACANLAHLLLSRITERREELLLRVALGASRGRLVQQLITETTVLTLAAAAGGLAVAQWTARLASSIRPPSLTVQAYTILDWPVVTFAMGVALLTGLIFGALSSGLVRRIHPAADPLRTPFGGYHGGASHLLACLVAMQAAFTVILLAGALTMSRSFLKLAGTNLGLHTGRVVVMNVALSGTAHEKNAPAYYREALQRLRGVPGVEAAAAIEFLPLESNNMASFRFGLEGFGVPITTTPDYFRATGTPILEGRDFTAADEAGSKPVAIVNETFARQFDSFPHLVGESLLPAFGTPVTIIGVARTQRYSPTGDEMAVVYHTAGWAAARNMSIVARVRGDAALYEPVCRDAVRGTDPAVPVYNVATLDERLRDSLSGPRFYTTAVTFLGGFALLLAVLGIYGVASFAIQQRTHEIGVRMAVGAPPHRLRVALLREALLPVGSGLLIGMLASVAFGRVLENLMEAVDSVGVPTCAAAGGVLAAAAATAIWTATRRIVRMDPMRVLRAD